MQYMDMKTGLDDGKYYEKIYEDDTKYFNISMTNSAFTYDPATNIIRVNPGDEPEQDGEMIITWKNQEGTFNTKPCARKIKLHWDRLRDGYYIAFQSNGGSFVDAITGKYNAETHLPAGMRTWILPFHTQFRKPCRKKTDLSMQNGKQPMWVIQS